MRTERLIEEAVAKAVAIERGAGETNTPPDKPQEWTAKDGCLYHGERRWPMEYRQSAQEVADEIKATIAAERERAEASEYNFGVQVDETKRLTVELERERMCHAACGVITMSNTLESLEKIRAMKPEYLSASVQDCIKSAEREIALREQLAAERKMLDKEIGQSRELWKQLAAEREKVAYLELQRDALLRITWLDLPSDPDESTTKWQELFTKGWVRRNE